MFNKTLHGFSTAKVKGRLEILRIFAAYNISPILMRYFLCFCFFLCLSSLPAQVSIHELDADTPSTDTMEFIELLTDNPDTALDGYVLVLFNGSDNGMDQSYFSLDLDGLTSDANGILLIGSNDVSPVPDFILFDNTIQNGADAVAVYLGDATDFPDGTLATTTNLIDALVYDTNDADDTNLLALLGETTQINEGGNGPSSANSIQSDLMGGYTIAPPTPGALNDGSGIAFIGLGFSVAQEQYDEGAQIDIVFTADQVLTEDVTFDFSLTNATFTTADYTGPTTATILSGSTTTTISIQIIDDADNEGDEEMLISFGPLPSGYKRLNDNLIVRIVDNDFTTAAWGTPLAPTYGQISSTQAPDYYDPIEGLSEDALVQALQDIIANPDVVRAQSYADVIDILIQADQNPENSNEVWLVYTEQPRAKLDFQTSGGSSVGLWNREHTYPRSRGGFDDIEADEIADGIDVFFLTKADSTRHANSDGHGLRAADGPENSSRGNQDYGEYSGPSGTQGSWQGDVARSIFFLSIRYNGLEVVSGNPSNSTVGQLGDLDVLLDWHRNDPPDDYEMNRNNIVAQWQFNRNPFIDLPELAEYIWGNNVGDPWMNPLSVTDTAEIEFSLYPNPSHKRFRVVRNSEHVTLTIFNMLGQAVFNQHLDNDYMVQHDLDPGMYIVSLENEYGSKQLRLIVK